MIQWREHIFYILENTRISKWKLYLINNYEYFKRKYAGDIHHLFDCILTSPYNRPPEKT